MADSFSQAGRRLTQIRDTLLGKTATTIPFDPDATSFPTRKNLPKIVGAPDEAAWVWGKEDYIGRLNLLTPSRVKAAASEIRTGEMARLDLPLNVPEQPAFGRQKFEHKILTVREGVAYDDVYHCNTQSGTQWDGFRHFAHMPTRTFYNNTHGADIVGSEANHKCSIHHWSTHGFSGRAILLDYRAYADAHGIKYDTATAHAISYDDLVACGKWQGGLDIRPVAQGGDVKVGDILLIRSGWVEDYYMRTPEERERLALRGRDSHGGEQQWAGLKQEEAIKDWLHDCYFAAVGGDAPSFERWPTPEAYYLHEYILALWGMPLGEMLDLEKVAELARKNKRWTFFFSSAPANMPGGVSSHVNGTAIF
jgi:kynurenine formamidase